MGVSSNVGDILKVAHILRKVQKPLLVLVSKIRPRHEDLQVLDAPLIWTQEGRQQSFLVYKHCPKIDKSKVETIRLFNVWKDEQKNWLTQLQCPGYIKGQTLTLGYVPTSVSAHVNGKVVPGGGYFARMFEYLSQFLEFEPRFKIGPSVYHSLNDSWAHIPQQVH